MDLQRLNDLAKYDFSGFIPSENNVKYKLIIPFLQAFNHQDLDLEHAAQGSRIDINIGNRIIVETKALGQNLNLHVQQLSDYCGREWPVLAILTNGKQFRIYSPLWRQQQQQAFGDKIIYSFEITDLSNVQLLNRLEKIIGFSNYESEDFLEHIEEREKEIIKVQKEIENIEQLKSKEVDEIKSELTSIKEQIAQLNNEVKLKEQAISAIESKSSPEIKSLVEESFLPINAQPVTQVTDRTIPTHFYNGHNQGEQLVINNLRSGVLAFGHLQDNNNFLVLKGSTVSTGVAPKFETSARKAYALRNQYLQDGTINTERQFTRDVVFTSISSAASVIMGDSKNGNMVWTKK